MDELTDERFLEIVKRAVNSFEGYADTVESAVGALAFGRRYGWQALRLIHSGRTFRKFEEVLDLKFRDVLPERTRYSRKVAGIRLADAAGKFWQVVTAGMVPAREAKIVGNEP